MTAEPITVPSRTRPRLPADYGPVAIVDLDEQQRRPGVAAQGSTPGRAAPISGELIIRYVDRARSEPGGTRLTDSYEFLWCPIVNRLAGLPVPRGSQVNRGIEMTLANVKAAAEAFPHLKALWF